MCRGQNNKPIGEQKAFPLCGPGREHGPRQQPNSFYFWFLCPSFCSYTSIERCGRWQTWQKRRQWIICSYLTPNRDFSPIGPRPCLLLLKPKAGFTSDTDVDFWDEQQNVSRWSLCHAAAAAAFVIRSTLIWWQTTKHTLYPRWARL